MLLVSIKRRQSGPNYDILGRYSWYVPGWSGMFSLLGFVLLGAVLGSVASVLLTLLVPGVPMDITLLVSYPLQFLPAMIYAGYRSGALSFNESGIRLDSRHFAPLGAVRCALLVMAATLFCGFCCDALSTLLPDMPEALKKVFENMTGGSLWANFLAVSIFAPFFEEWLCRGMIMRGLLGRGTKPRLAIVVSALFFAVIHMNPWQAIPAFLLGCLFGYVYYKTGSLLLTMLMHFTNNSFALLCSRIPSLEDMETWMEVMPAAQYWCLFAAGIAVLICTILAFGKIKLENPEGNFDRVPSLFEE